MIMKTVFKVDGKDHGACPIAGQHFYLGQQIHLEDAIGGQGGRFKVLDILPVYSTSTGHMSVTEQLAGGGGYTWIPRVTEVYLERLPEQG